MRTLSDYTQPRRIVKEIRDDYTRRFSGSNQVFRNIEGEALWNVLSYRLQRAGVEGHIARRVATITRDRVLRATGYRL